MSEALFTDDQRRTLACALDEIVPPSADGRRPGAGELGLADHVERGLAATAPVGAIVQQGLAALDDAARSRGAAGFAALAPADRTAVFAEIAAAQPGFVGPLVFHTYVGYYQHPRALAAIGLEPRPPHPKGHALEPGDFTLLDAVRRRGAIWRPA